MRSAAVLFPWLLIATLGFAQNDGVLPQETLPDVPPIPPVPAKQSPSPLESLGKSTGMFATPAIPNTLKISHEGTIEFDNNAGTIHYHGGVAMRADTGLQIFADDMLLDTKQQQLVLTGNVSVYQGNLLQRGDKAIYHYQKKELDTSGMRASVDPFLLESGRFRMEQHNGKPVFIGENAGVTTHDIAEPNYWIRADKTLVYPGEKIVFHDLRLFAGDTPVFWLPYLSQPLDAELGYHFIPGARTNWGAYLLNSYGIMLGGDRDSVTGERENQWLLSKWHLDLRSRRGVGAGVDLVDTRIRKEYPAATGLSLYYLNDLNPSINNTGLPRGFVNEDRYRLNFQNIYPFQFEDKANWDLRFDLSKLSDRFFLEDFDPPTARINPAPDNTVGLYRRDDSSLLSLFTRLRVNDFYQTDSRLPELAFDQVRRPIFGSPFLHEGQTSIGLYRENLADFAEDRLRDQLAALPPGDPLIPVLEKQLEDNGFGRFYTNQEISMPLKVGGWLTVTPQAGVGYTRYWDVEGTDPDTDRTHVQIGTEASLKFSKTYDNIHSRFWGLDRLLHTIQPYAGWYHVSTNELDPSFNGIDTLTFSTRPNPLDVGRFTAIDDIMDWNIIRLGTRNRLVTKRDDQNFEWLTLDTYMDAYVEDPELNRDFSNLYNDLHWHILPWIDMSLETQFPIVSNGSEFSEVTSRVRFMPNERFEFSVGNRFLNNHPVLIDSNRLDLRGYYRINEKWGIGGRQVWEFDDGTLETQQYTLSRSLENWIAGVGLTHRDNRTKDEFGIIFSLTLREFPSVTLPFRIDSE